MKQLSDEGTIKEIYGPAMEITDPDEAEEYFELLVNRNMRVTGNTREEAEDIERQNLGYYAGYCSPETMEQVNRLFKTRHPVFGSTAPTPEKAFNMGKAEAENS